MAITPALAGPYDYGTVVVRVALNIDPLDAHVVADSEAVPQVIGGVPIRMREIRVKIDRERFMLNPTNCSPLSVASQGIGDQGTVANFSSYFHVDNCASLPFAPRMTIAQVGGRKFTDRAKDPSVRFDLRTNSGDANLRSATVTLPRAFEIDQRHLGNICSKTELEPGHCAGRQPIGTVRDETPLLEKPLQGLAYAVSGYGNLPHVAFVLGGQVTVIPQGESVTVGPGRLRTTVPLIPDVPIGHFQLTLFGGKQGYLTNTQSLCAHQPAANVEFTGQNGKVTSRRVVLKTGCSSKAKRRRAGRRSSH